MYWKGHIMYSKHRIFFKTALCASFCTALLSACATPTGPVDVTRFSKAGAISPNAQGIYQGSFAFDKELQDNNLTLAPYKSAVNREMQRLGFNQAREQADYIISIKTDRYNSERPKNSNVSVGGGASTGSFGSGVGLGLGINLSGRKKRTHTELAVRITKNDTGESIWEGRAIQAAKTSSPAAQEGIAASKLASALFQGFPGTSGDTIEVQ